MSDPICFCTILHHLSLSINILNLFVMIGWSLRCNHRRWVSNWNFVHLHPSEALEDQNMDSRGRKVRWKRLSLNLFSWIKLWFMMTINIHRLLSNQVHLRQTMIIANRAISIWAHAKIRFAFCCANARIWLASSMKTMKIIFLFLEAYVQQQ